MKVNTSNYTACSKKEILCSDLLDLPFPRPIQPRCYVVDPIECGREKHLHCTLFTATNAALIFNEILQPKSVVTVWEFRDWAGIWESWARTCTN